MRDRGDPKMPFALSLSYKGQTKHYKITAHKTLSGDSKLSIEDGPRFESLMDVSSIISNPYVATTIWLLLCYY